MVFELTDPLVEAILFAMENQEKLQVLDARSSTVVPAENEKVDQEIVYSLPSWTSSDGYKMLEDFVSTLHVPQVHDELKQVLISGRGVFRNFKNVLKAYPEVERMWHFFKYKKMHTRLIEWYNMLRESWGLEKLDQEIDECDDLIREDFTFREYNPAQDRDCVVRGVRDVAEEFKQEWPDEVGLAVADMWLRQCEYGTHSDAAGFVSRSVSDEFAGCIMVVPCPSSAKKTVSLSVFFVLQNFRGLGIGEELFLQCLSHLRERGIQWVLIGNTIIPRTLEPLLTRLGFEQTGFGFVADLLVS